MRHFEMLCEKCDSKEVRSTPDDHPEFRYYNEKECCKCGGHLITRAELDKPYTYKIIRCKFRGESEIIKTGLTLKEAQDHCNDPTTKGGVGITRWFDSYTKE